MNIICWNIRGLKGAHKKEIVRNIIRDQRPEFLLIQETKMRKDVVGKLSFNKYMSSKATDLEEALGGMLMLYNNKAYQSSTIYNVGNSILCKVSHIHSDDSWSILNLYAPISKRERKAFWAKILEVISVNNIKKGIIMRDFNSPLTDDDKYGGLSLDQESKLDLSSFINNLAYMDVDLLGGRFTWPKRRVGGEYIQVHLDRALISTILLQSHSYRISLLPRVGSNHSTI